MCLGIVSHPPSLACWRDNKLMVGCMPFVYLVEIMGIKPVTQWWRWGADKGALAALGVPHLLAGQQAGEGTDDGALAFLAVPLLAHGTAAVTGEVCLGIVGHPLLAGETKHWQGSVPWHCWPSLARRRNGKLAVGQMAVPWHPWTLLVHVLVATAGGTESLAIPYLLA